MNSRMILIFFVVMLSLMGCNSTYTSKKRGYYKIPFPAHEYKPYDDAEMPFRFEYPVYAKVVRDSTFFYQGTDDKYWVNVDFPDYNAKIFLSYKPIGGRSIYKVKTAAGTYRDSIGSNDFDKLVNDAYNLTSKNEVVATSIRDSVFTTPNGITGVFFKVGGNAATARQFFVTDTTHNFLRGALYFDATPNADSLEPVNLFLQQDIYRIINSLQWKAANSK